MQVLLAVMTPFAPSLYWDASADGAAHDGVLAMCVDASGQADEDGAGGSDNGMRQHHSHSCAGHVLGVLDIGVRMHIAESRDPSPSEPPPGVLRIFSTRLDRPPLTPDLA